MPAVSSASIAGNGHCARTRLFLAPMDKKNKNKNKKKNQPKKKIHNKTKKEKQSQQTSPCQRAMAPLPQVTS